ncbi:RhoGAP [Niveomyces insectorum RCEF 264]|uniref:RhoGAP n=1 Tax=Niveomyces insectorum RCEF 264 TaxID=1081102 RepID=A0A167YYT2_9HYPO|nr:RhoGAP [Niveomyces insectorum RCEF 264]
MQTRAFLGGAGGRGGADILPSPSLQGLTPAMQPSTPRMAAVEQPPPPPPPLSHAPDAVAARPSSGFSLDGNQRAGQGNASSQPDRRSYHGSRPWTSASSGADDLFADEHAEPGLSQQGLLLQEYNLLASTSEQDSQSGERRNWFARTFGKPPASAPRRSSRQSAGPRSEKGTRHKRNGSDPSVQCQGLKKDTVDALKNQSLQTLVRICGKSLFYLPSEYATRSLMLPTCFRAAAQYLVQNGPDTRGIFRISGSVKVVNELYDYYGAHLDEENDIAATVRSPNLPFHIKAGIHDVASMFKRLLAGLPGGILGQLSLFEALVGIYRAYGRPDRFGFDFDDATAEPDSSGRNSRTRARLIALAIGAVPSHLQRELICAVFGLLCLIGRAAETAPRHDTEGNHLPNSERMGYGALGIIFGPLLMGDLLESYIAGATDDALSSPALAAPSSASSSPRSKTDKRRKSTASDKRSLPILPLTLDNILLANDIAEMLITHWRDVVHQMKNVGIMRKESTLQPHQQHHTQQPPRALRPTRSETFGDQDENSSKFLPGPVFNGLLT